MDKLIYYIPLISILGIFFALMLTLKVKKQSPGNERMQKPT